MSKNNEETKDEWYQRYWEFRAELKEALNNNVAKQVIECLQ